MPIYVYEFIHEDGQPGARFEYRQKMSDPPLEAHPISKQPVRRVITAANIGGKDSEQAIAANISDDRIAELGLTKYVKAGDGVYEKHTGKGPDVISAEDA